MIEFLLKRPVGVIMTFVGLVVFGFIALKQLPISLLPDIEVPSIIVKINYPNGAPEEIEQNALQKIRTSLITLQGLKNMESWAGNESGTVELTFEYDVPMSLAYIEVNEKIDQLSGVLPNIVPRPQVVRINTSDIPVLRVQVIPKDIDEYLEISDFTEKVLRKRIESLDGVSLVDINGLRRKALIITPNSQKLNGLGLTDQDIIRAIRENNEQLGGISVRSGHYRYYLKITSEINNIEGLKNLPISTIDGNTVLLRNIADIHYGAVKNQGYHLFNKKEGLVITVHKQATARVGDLVDKLKTSLLLFENEFPKIEFAITQDQSLMLNSGIDNLKSSLMYGGIFAFLVLFFFMSNYKIPWLIGISLPTSLIVSFLFFYLTGISINVISLSGLALGLGMMIDNAIIVIDNITRKKEQGLSLFESCVTGTNEIIAPLISSVLTTLSVFVPLIFLSGISGALFYDQAIAVACILVGSLIVAFVLLPLLYHLIFGLERVKKQNQKEPFLFGLILRIYEIIHDFVFKRKLISALIFFLIIPISIYLSDNIKIEGLPELDKRETLLHIDWNEPISVEENKRRVIDLLSSFDGLIECSESDIGLSQFMMNAEKSEIQSANIYMFFANEFQQLHLTDELDKVFLEIYPNAGFNIKQAPNAFEQIFVRDNPFLEARIKHKNKSEPIPFYQIDSIYQSLENSSVKQGVGISRNTMIDLSVDLSKLKFYKISDYEDTIDKLFNDFEITEIKRFGSVTPILLKEKQDSFDQRIASATFKSKEGALYPANHFLSYRFIEDYKTIHADKTGIYQSFIWSEVNNIDSLINSVKNIITSHNLDISFEGLYFDNSKDLKELVIILGISTLLLYFILTIQFESFIQPFVVIFMLPIGISGSIFILYITNTSVNIMSAIGIVVMLGIIVNDAILKIDTINRLKSEHADELMSKELYRGKLYEIISIAGKMRFKPIIMTSITTILAVTPILFSSGIGADLQKPLVYAVVGGLSIGTFMALYYVPLGYFIADCLSEKVSKFWIQ